MHRRERGFDHGVSARPGYDAAGTPFPFLFEPFSRPREKVARSDG
jgi:hypothetical protein